MKICHLGPEYADQVTEIALKGKAHWGYDEKFMEQCREELSYRARTFQEKDVFGALKDGTLAGFIGNGLAGARRCG